MYVCVCVCVYVCMCDALSFLLPLQKGTKNSLETGRTFATIFADMDFRQRLLEATNEEEFKRLIIKHSQELAEEQQVTNDKRIEMNHERVEEFEYVSDEENGDPLRERERERERDLNRKKYINYEKKQKEAGMACLVPVREK